MAARHLILPREGTLLVNTDVHGSGDDFRRMRDIFEADADTTHWAILGDIVHAPDARARAQRPDLYDYNDASGDIAAEILRLQHAYPGRVHFVLGNHDWAHVGGPTVAKFWPDEAAHLEEQLTPEQVLSLHKLFRKALLCLVAPCGAFLSHGSPGALFDSFAELDAIEVGGELAPRQQALIKELTNFYGQREAVSRSFLQHASDLSGEQLAFVIHGHDRDENGWFVHEETQICPVIFGAPRENRRYLRLNLAARYDSVHALREGHEILRLWDTDG